MRLARLVLLVLMSAVPDGDDKVVDEVEKALHGLSRQGPAPLIAALDGLRGHDSARIAELLATVFAELEKMAAPIERGARGDLEKGDLSPGEVIARRKKVDPVRSAENAVLQRVRALQSKEALLWMVAHLLGDEKVALSLKLEAARNASTLGEAAVGPFTLALGRAKASDDVITVLVGLGQLGPMAKPLADQVLPFVDHADATVREEAAAALARIAAPQAIEPLIARLEKETDRTQVRFAAALEVLTNQKFGLGVNAWKSWFAAEGLRYTSGAEPLGGGVAQVTVQPAGYFHGIPQDSRSIVYVIDLSGSMIVSLTNPQFQDGAQKRPIAAPPGEESRMDCSKKELIKALGALPDGMKFDIVRYGSTAETWSPKMVEASAASIKRAQKFVEELEPVGATNIYDAMELAFSLAGRGTTDRFYGTQVDTLFLLTDGQPSLTNGEDSTEKILLAVKRMNPLQRVIIHTIGLGKGINADFLKRLAADNKGVFVQR